MRRALVLVAVLVAGTLVDAGPARGCVLTGPVPTEAQYLARADVVFEGVAGPRRDPSASAPNTVSLEPIFWSFTVDRVIKGAASPVQEVGTTRSTCGLTFNPGDRYRVFATYENGVLMTALGSGTRLAPVVTATTTVPRPPGTNPPRRIALTG